MIAIIDYKMGNVRSVAKALECVGARVRVTASPLTLRRAKALVLPGVGAFGSGMRHLRQLKLIPEITQATGEDKPFIGICLGMQLLFGCSEEHGRHNGLNIIDGDVIRFRGSMKIPHMGWNQVVRNPSAGAASVRILADVPDAGYCYFVHSYYVRPRRRSVVVATSEYGRKFCCVVAQKNTIGVQFHPEKSSDTGLQILTNFCRMAGEIA